MSGNDQDVLKVYLQKVMELSDARSSGPTEAELQTIAREVGISEAELAAAAKSAEDHRVRGLGFLDHERYDDAIAEFSEASALTPGRLDVRHALARAYAGRYRQRGRVEDHRQAEVLARRCLELDPDHGASFELLNELDRPSSPTPSGRSARAAVGGAVILGLLAVTGGVFFLRDSSPAPVPIPAVSETVAKTTSPAPPVTDTAELDIPIEFDTGADPDLALNFETRLSRLNNYPTGKSFYTLNAVFENRGATELEKVKGRLEFRDAGGRLLKTKDLDLHSGSAAPLRPGDRQALHQLVEVVQEVRRANLVVARVEQTPAAGDYGVASPVELEWQEPQPSGTALSVRERARRYSENALLRDSGGYFEAVLEVENTGSRSIRALKLKVTITGPDGTWTNDIERHVVTRSGPDLRTGGSRVVRFLGQVQERPKDYRVSVIGIR